MTARALKASPAKSDAAGAEDEVVVTRGRW